MQKRVSKLRKLVPAVIGFLSFISLVNGQSDVVRTDREIVAWAKVYMDNAVKFDHFSGSVLIARNGKPIFRQGYGLANMELDVPNKPETKFRIGSVSKQFTAAAIMKLQEEGKLRITDPVCKYVSDCPDVWQPITIKHLLNHTSGIVNFTSLPEASGSFLMLPQDHASVVNTFRNKPLESQPGEKYNYNNSGYYLLGLIVEKASGNKFADYVQKTIFDPLGMANSGFDDQKTIVKNRASSYSLGEDMVFYNSYYTNMDILFSIGGFYSTVEDLLLWERSFTSNKILKRSTVDEMFTPGKGGYGYGWWIDKLGKYTRMYHDGGITDFSASLQRLPDEGLTIIAISNCGDDGGLRAAYDIVGKISGVPATIRAIQPELEKLPSAQTLKIIANAKASFPIFDIRERKVEELGNYLMLVKKQKQAIEVFKVNVSLYPQSSNACLKLGMAYKNNGEKDTAAETFKQCLKLDPQNKLAAEQLKARE